MPQELRQSCLQYLIRRAFNIVINPFYFDRHTVTVVNRKRSRRVAVARLAYAPDVHYIFNVLFQLYKIPVCIFYPIISHGEYHRHMRMPDKTEVSLSHIAEAPVRRFFVYYIIKKVWAIQTSVHDTKIFFVYHEIKRPQKLFFSVCQDSLCPPYCFPRRIIKISSAKEPCRGPIMVPADNFCFYLLHLFDTPMRVSAISYYIADTDKVSYILFFILFDNLLKRFAVTVYVTEYTISHI